MDPLHQFEISVLQDIHVAGLNLSFTNAALWMVISAVVATSILMLGMRRRALVPGRMQSVAEMLYEFVANMVRDNAGADARPYFPLVFSLFVFILFGNLLGMIPGAFTFTSHIINTFALALLVFVFVTILGLVRHGLHFFSFFVPHGVPLWLAPLIVPIEVISYLTRPVSLSIRLFANMLAGHMMLKVFAGFTILLGGAMGATGYAIGILPIAINVALIGLEFLVAFLQAYVFTILTCLYLRDALELH